MKPAPLVYVVGFVVPIVFGVLLALGLAEWQLAASPSVALFIDAPHRAGSLAIMHAVVTFVFTAFTTSYLGLAAWVLIGKLRGYDLVSQTRCPRDL